MTFDLVQQVIGYSTKDDETLGSGDEALQEGISDRRLVSGSKNVLMNDQSRIETSKGFEVLGATSATNSPVKSSFDWTTSTDGIERNLRGYDDELEFLFTDATGTKTWTRLKDSWTSVDFQFATWWDTTEGIDKLLWVNGLDKIWEWTGLVTTVASVTSTTITKQDIYTASTIAFVDSNPDTITDSASGFVTAGFTVGDRIVVTGSTNNNSTFKIAAVTAGVITLVGGDSLTAESAGSSITIKKEGKGTWAQERAATSGTRKVVINDVEYTYTGGEGTATLTGVTPDPTAAATTISAGDVCFQAIVEHDNEPVDGFEADGIRELNNQIYVGSRSSREVYISKNTDFKDFSFSTPREPGEGAKLTLDDAWRAFGRQNDIMFIGGGREGWYEVSFQAEIQISSTLVETVSVKKAKTSGNLAPTSQDLTIELGDSIVFVSQEPALRSFGSFEDLEGLNLKTLSDPIKPDFDAANFLNGSMMFNDERVYITAPNDGIVYILQFNSDPNGNTTRFWQPPQDIPIRRMAVIGGVTHGHSSGTPETYKLFTGTAQRDNDEDNRSAIEHAAYLAYRSFGERVLLKQFDGWYIEGYIAENTKILHELNYDYRGHTALLSKTIDGSDTDIVFGKSPAGLSLGTEILGEEGLGGATESNPDSGLVKFRVIQEFELVDFFEVQEVFTSSNIDQRWQLLASGPDVTLTPNKPNFIKQ